MVIIKVFYGWGINSFTKFYLILSTNWIMCMRCGKCVKIDSILWWGVRGVRGWDSQDMWINFIIIICQKRLGMNQIV